ncbi:MAG: FMN-binding protein [Rhizobacter sp.]|nr:FMN-binding protein [Rhizobacter sp.]
MNSQASEHRAIHEAPTETVSGRRLGRNGRRVLLAAHITLTCVWLGALLVTLLLVGMQLAQPVATWRPGLDRAVLLVHDTLVVNASYGFILTGLLFSLFTSWGAFRMWWILLKWVLLALLGLALPLWVAPHVSGMTAWSDALSGQVEGNAAYAAHVDAVLLATATQLIVLVGIVVLSVFKPWGPRPVRRAWPRGVSLVVASLMVLGLAGNLWLQEVQLEGLRQLPVAVVDVASRRDGSHEGRETQADFTYRVRVTVADGRIERVEVLANRDTHYGRLAALAADKLAGRSRNDVDAISGATTTSKGLMRAVADALQNAPLQQSAR